ncbi:Ribosomal RNA adenine methyltransferase KsgA/Erm, partial [Dillenia turbinata]
MLSRLSSNNPARFINPRNYSPSLYSKLFRRHRNNSDGDEDESDNWRKKNNEKSEGHVPIQLHKSRGQHILTNPRVLDTIVRKSEIKPTDTVLEVGPGTGNLTLRLLEVAKKVIAVEIDGRMVEILNNRVAERGFEEKLMTEFPPFDLVVANIPYGISSPLVAKIVFGANPFRGATLLLQKEFARRLLAKPGDSEFNRLAVNVKLLADVEFVMDVSKRDFLPCPKVDSSVVKIRPKFDIPKVDLGEWWAFTRTCFSKKNKTLGATFKQKKKVMELLAMSQRIITNKENIVNDYANHFSDDEDGFSEVESDEGDYSYTGEEPCMFKKKIISVLDSGDFSDKRPSKLSIEDLLYLLSLFNQAGGELIIPNNPKRRVLNGEMRSEDSSEGHLYWSAVKGIHI